MEHNTRMALINGRGPSACFAFAATASGVVSTAPDFMHGTMGPSFFGRNSAGPLMWVSAELANESLRRAPTAMDLGPLGALSFEQGSSNKYQSQILVRSKPSRGCLRQ